MARITAGPLVGSVQGKIGGVVFRGAGSRASVSLAPSVRRAPTVRQLDHRRIFADTAAQWPGLDPRAKQTWTEYVRQALPPAGVAGRTVKSARAAFVQWAAQIALCGLARPLDYPPQFAYFPAPEVIVEASGGGAPGLVLKIGVLATDIGIAVWLARARCMECFASRPAYRPLFVGAQDGATDYTFHPETPATPIWVDLGTEWAERFPDAAEGSIWQARFQMAQDLSIWSPATLSLFEVAA